MNKAVAAIENKIVGILNPDKTLQRPHNRLWLALMAFNAIFLPLDIATGVTVGLITRWYYGVFVFGAGFGTMVLHEALYSNAYAKGWQKAISVFGFLTSIAVTGLIGVVAIGVNILYTGYDRELAGVVMAGASFLTLFLHGILFATYYFIDGGIVAKQKAGAAMAEHDRQMQQFAMAQQLVDQYKNIQSVLEASVESGDSRKLAAALSGITGEDWSEISGVSKLPAQPLFVRNNAEVEAPELVDPTTRQSQK